MDLPPPPALVWEDATSGPVRARLAEADGADLVVLYGGDQRGSMDVCGCEHRPLGSLARVEGYRRLAARGDAPVLLVNAGGFLDDGLAPHGGLRDDVRVAGDHLIAGLRKGSWTVWNVGTVDLPWFAANGFPAEAVSANLAGPAPIAAWRVVEVGGLRVAVTGVTGGPESIEGWTVRDPAESVREALTGVPPADLVVVLAHEPGRAARSLATLPGVDVLIEVGADPARFPPLWEGEAVWVRAAEQTTRLGELRLDLEAGRVTAATDRQIDLDAKVPSDAALARHQARARRAVEEARSLSLGSR